MTSSLMNKDLKDDLEILINLIFRLLDEKHHQRFKDWMETDEYKNAGFIDRYRLLNSFRLRKDIHKL